MGWKRTAAVSVLAVVVLATTAAPALAQRGPYSAVARMVTSEGAAAGRVELVSLDALLGTEGSGEGGTGFGVAVTGRRVSAQFPDLTIVTARLRGLPPGFHGFHVHETGRCDAPAFASAGGHFQRGRADHPNHAGDMPLLYVNEDGTAIAAFFTDRFAVRHLFDADGSAIVVHAGPDNYANIPRDRYDPDPDATTRATGDAGGRIACAVVSRGRPTAFPDEGAPVATAHLQRRDGSVVGEAVFAPFAGRTVAAVFVEGSAPGFHGLHVHETGRCDRPSFVSAGGHFDPVGTSHGAHAGDLPVLYVSGVRIGFVAFVTDRFRIRDLVAGDGTAVVVHANADNYAHIPADRYDPDPDPITLATGDAGDRIACGVVRRLVRCTVSVSPNRFRTGVRTTLRVRVRSGGRPVQQSSVSVQGPGFAMARPPNSRGVARFTIRPTRPGRVRVSVDPGLETLGCRTSRPIVGARVATTPALAARA